MIIIEKLTKKHQNDIAEISANCFLNDEYFDFLSKNKQEKKEKLKEMYLGAYNIAEQTGECFGAFINNELVGYVIVLDYDTLQSNPQIYNEVFDTSKSEFGSDVHQFVKYANGLKNAKYILSVCVDPKHQKKGIGFQLIEHITKQYKTGHIISDVDNKNSLSIYKRLGFNIKTISDKFYIIHKDLTKSLETENAIK